MKKFITFHLLLTIIFLLSAQTYGLLELDADVTGGSYEVSYDDITNLVSFGGKYKIDEQMSDEELCKNVDAMVYILGSIYAYKLQELYPKDKLPYKPKDDQARAAACINIW